MRLYIFLSCIYYYFFLFVCCSVFNIPPGDLRVYQQFLPIHQQWGAKKYKYLVSQTSEIVR